MDTKYRLLQFDYWIQTILGSAILACFVTLVGFYFGIWGLIPFGVIQVLSGLGFAIGYRDRKRMVYLLLVALFFLLWYASYALGKGINSEWINSFNVFLCLIPPSLGIWYFRLTAKEYKALKKQREKPYSNDEQILDA